LSRATRGEEETQGLVLPGAEEQAGLVLPVRQRTGMHPGRDLRENSSGGHERELLEG